MLINSDVFKSSIRLHTEMIHDWLFYSTQARNHNNIVETWHRFETKNNKKRSLTESIENVQKIIVIIW